MYPPRDEPTILVVVGNPKPASRTRAVGEAVAGRVAAAMKLGLSVDPRVDTLEVAEIGPNLLGWGDPAAAVAVERLMDADLLVVASPVFKATYTGLLKLLFDQVGAGQLRGTPAVPLMVGAGPHHAMAVDAHLRPLLVEVGASCPTAGLYVLDFELDVLDDTIETWTAAAAPLIVGAMLGSATARAVAS